MSVPHRLVYLAGATNFCSNDRLHSKFWTRLEEARSSCNNKWKVKKALHNIGRQLLCRPSSLVDHTCHPVPADDGCTHVIVEDKERRPSLKKKRSVPGHDTEVTRKISIGILQHPFWQTSLMLTAFSSGQWCPYHISPFDEESFFKNARLSAKVLALTRGTPSFPKPCNDILRLKRTNQKISHSLSLRSVKDFLRLDKGAFVGIVLTSFFSWHCRNLCWQFLSQIVTSIFFV